MSSLDFNSTDHHHQVINFMNATVATNNSINYSNYGNSNLLNVTETTPTTTTSTSRALLATTLDALFNTTVDYLYSNTTKLYGNHYDDNNQTIAHANQTIGEEELLKKDHVFDRTDVRVIFITMYTLVFCCCFFGKCWCELFNLFVSPIFIVVM